MERITSHQVLGLMGAYNAVYSPQINEDYIWESCLTEEFISEAYQTVADYLVHNGFVPGYNTAEVYMSEMAVEDIDSILFETGVLNEQYLIEAGFFQGLGAGADRFVSGAKKNIQGAASNVQRLGQTAVGGAQRLGTAAVGGAQRLGAGAQRLGTAAVGGAQRLGTAAVGAVQRAVTPVAQAVQGTAQRAVSAGQSALGSAGKAIQGTGQAIAGGAQRVAGAVAGVANAATRAVGGAGRAVANKIGQEVEISRKVGAGEPLGGSPTAKSTPSRVAGARDKVFSGGQGKGGAVVGPKTATPAPGVAGARDKVFSGGQGKGGAVVGPKTATPAPGARPATPAASMAKPATPAAKSATPAATTGNPPLKPPALPPITGKPSLKSGIDDLKKMGDASRQRQASMLNQSFDPFDYILEYLVAEGYADTNEAAISIMANMSEEWREGIVDESYKEIDREKLGRMNKRSKNLTRAAMKDAQETGEASGLNRVKMGKMNRVIDRAAENIRNRG